MTPTLNECPGFDTNQSDDEVPVMLKLWGMRSTPSLPLLPAPLWPGVVAPDKGPIYWLNRTKPWFWQLDCVLTFKLRAYAKLNCLKWNCFWHWIVLTLNWIILYRTSVLILNWICWIWSVWINWIAWNRNVFDELCTHAKLNFFK